MSELLKIQGLGKRYPGVIANEEVRFDIGYGEVHALLGENGAGKSTLVKMIYGLVQPDEGTMRLHNRLYSPSSPREARAVGIGMVFQHFSLFEGLTVAENIALGLDDPLRPRLLSRQIVTVSQAYGLPLDPDRVVGTLSAGERQRVEIVRCLLKDPRLLIMDEPTSVLTPQEVDQLFRTLRRLAEEGVSILYISHKLEEIRALCDTATILRGGRKVATCDPAAQSAHQLAEMMIGQDLKRPEPRKARPGDVMLAINALSLPAETAFGRPLKSISASVRAGEILGIAGVAGNGQEELMAALSGERRGRPDSITVNGQPMGHTRPNSRRAAGLLTAPEDRLGHAAAPSMTLWENAFLSARVRQRLTWNGFLKRHATGNFARAIINRFDVRTPNVDVAAKSLSGGNLQKFLIGREILQRPRVLVANQPTWGVDAAAAATIRAALKELAEEGTAIVVISQDLDELMEVADTLAVIEGGRLSHAISPDAISIDELGILMAGGKPVPRPTKVLPGSLGPDTVHV